MNESVARLVSIAALGGAVASLALRGCFGAPTVPLPLHPSVPALAARDVTFALHPGAESHVTVRSLGGQLVDDLHLALVVDGVARAVDIDRSAVRYEGDVVTAALHADDDDAGAVEGTLTLRADKDNDLLTMVLTAGARPAALQIQLSTEGRPAFVSGVGSLADLGSVSGRYLVVEGVPPAPDAAREGKDRAPAHVLGLTSSASSLDVVGSTSEDREQGVPMHLDVTSAIAEPSSDVDVKVVVSPSSRAVWGAVYRATGEPVTRVKGTVMSRGIARPWPGSPVEPPRVQVYGLDESGAPRVVFDADPSGAFAVDVPKSVVEWYAALDASRTSTPILYTPGTPWDLRLDVSPGGELRVRITDPDTQKPLTARLLVHGIDGTLDPSFGPDYRASGAGPLMDALRGEVVTPLPAGRYRVAATKGIEWSVDATNIAIEPGRQTSVELAPRHVVPTPGIVGADMHVHARPSFDTPVLPEDRVLSLVAAGVDFAVPTEHNIVGDYGPMLAELDLNQDLAWLPGVEVTTFSPRFGHFGVFPFKGVIPPYRGTSPAALFQAAHRNDPARVLQVNHPRLPMSIGYFNVFHYQPQSGKPPPPGMRMDFDTLEVFNGYDLGKADRVEAVMHDWFALLDQGYRYVATGDSDSHRIQYQWAGYPRTLIAAGPAAGDKGPIDPLGVVAALKKGHATVTNGPILELKVLGAQPGDEVTTSEDPIPVEITVRAAPWVDVTSVEIIAGSKTLETLPVESRPTKLGPEAGSLEDAEARTVRLRQQILLPVGPSNTWVVAVARGTRKLDDVLPFMPTLPFAFTNPVWITRDPKALLRRRVTAPDAGAKPVAPADAGAKPHPP